MAKSKKDKHKKDKKKRKENKDRDRTDDRRSPPSPVRGTHRSGRLQSASLSPPPQRRSRQRTRSPSPPVRRYEWKHERLQEPRPARHTPPASSPSPPAILKRLRFRGADTEAGPTASRHRDRDRDRGQDQKPEISFEQDLRHQQKEVREPEGQARVLPVRAAPAPAAFVPEEQFWKQRRATVSPTRRSEARHEVARGSDKNVMSKAGSSVLSRLTFLASPPQKPQREREPSYDEEASRPSKTGNGKPATQSNSRLVNIALAAGGTEASDRRPSGKVKVTFRGKNQGPGQDHEPTGSRSRIEYDAPSSHTRAHSSQERDLRSRKPDRSEDRDVAEAGGSPQHFDPKLQGEASLEQRHHSPTPHQRTQRDSRGTPEQRPESRKRPRVQRHNSFSDARKEHVLDDPLPPHKGKPSEELQDGVHEEDYRYEDPGAGEISWAADDGTAAHRSRRARDAHEKQKRSKDKSRRKESKRHKTEKDSKRDFTPPPREHPAQEDQVGVSTSAQHGHHAMSGRSEGEGEDMRRSDAEQGVDEAAGPMEGTAKHPQPLEAEVKRPDSRQQSPAAAEHGADMLQQGDDTQCGRSQRARARQTTSPLPPPPQAGPTHTRGTSHATHSPASRRTRDHAANRWGEQRGGVRGQSRPTAQPPSTSNAVSGLDSQASSARRRPHAMGGGGSAQASRHERSFSPSKPPPPGPPPPPPGRQHQHRPVPPPGPPPPASPPASFSQGQQRHDGSGQFMQRRGRRAPGEILSTGDGGPSDRPSRPGWMLPADQRTQEQGGGVAMGEDHGNQSQPQQRQSTSRGDNKAHDRGFEDKTRQDRVRFPLPLVLPGFAVVGGVGKGRTMPGAMDVWRKVLARDLKVPAAEDSVVGAAVRLLLRQDDQHGKQSGPGGRTEKSDGPGAFGLGSASNDGRWNMFGGALRRGIDPAAWLEAQPKLRVAGGSDISDEAWRKKVQSCTNTVFQCSELLKVMKLRREADLRPA